MARLIVRCTGVDVRRCTVCGCRWRVRNDPTHGVMARLADADQQSCSHCDNGPISDLVLDPVDFDVHAAREYARRLIAEGERLELEREVFADWTRERGAGPESYEVWCGDGGWPGVWAAEYERRGLGPARAANGGAHLIRRGRRLLAALEGQPSECQSRCRDGRDWSQNTCMTCRGTGHNLAGALPAVVDSEASVWRAADSYDASLRRQNPRGGITDRQREILQRAQASGRWPDGAAGPVFRTTLTSGRDVVRHGARVGFRGQHRREAMTEPDQERGASITRQLWARAWGGYASHVMAWQFMRTVPRWRRGELLHAEQRRAREERRPWLFVPAGTQLGGFQAVTYEMGEDGQWRQVGTAEIEPLGPVAPQDSGPSVPG